jgi:hypothetical protein
MANGSDKAIREAVLRQLARFPGAEIQVSANEGAITLTGCVNGWAAKYMAEESARSVPGVKSVANDIAALPITGHLPGRYLNPATGRSIHSAILHSGILMD